MSTTEFDTRAAAAALRLDYSTRKLLESRPAAWWRTVLGVVGFDQPPLSAGRVPIATTMTPMLGNLSELCEVWRVGEDESREPLSSAQLGRVHYRYNDELLFGSLSIEERAGSDAREAVQQDGARLLQAAEQAYEAVFAVLEATRHRHLIRIWNYVPAINAPAGGEERYRLFNSARQAAFVKSGRAVMGSSVPAACALGSPAGAPLCIYFLAARHASKTIENPRQTSAYHYPPKFGRHSPTFSRACLFGAAHNPSLFISGTSSIVGHETVHAGDVVAQTRETLANINALVDEANRISGSKRYAMETLKLKVYVRDAGDLERIRAVLSRESFVDKPLYLEADICRDDLHVEIEALGESGV